MKEILRYMAVYMAGMMFGCAAITAFFSMASGEALMKSVLYLIALGLYCDWFGRLLKD